jgi:hypothetical protein
MQLLADPEAGPGNERPDPVDLGLDEDFALDYIVHCRRFPFVE